MRRWLISLTADICIVSLIIIDDEFANDLQVAQANKRELEALYASEFREELERGKSIFNNCSK